MPLYKQDPDNSKKQVPVANNRVLIDKATVPTIETIQERPSKVIVNINGTYAFLYETTSSIGANTETGDGKQIANYTTGSVLGNAAGGPVTLPIRPVAWRQTDAAGSVGDVTFVYKGRYRQDGGPA